MNSFLYKADSKELANNNKRKKMTTEPKFKRGQTWVNFMGHTLKVMGTIDNWVMLRYKRSVPFVKHENEMDIFLKKVEAKTQNQTK